MTAPFDITEIIPTKYKAWVGLVGSVLTLVVPFVLEAQQYLPTGANLAIGGVLAVLTSLGIYHAPYTPPGAVLIPDKPNTNGAVAGGGGGGGYISAPVRPADGTYRNPWA